jgi:hypothetical protein
MLPEDLRAALRAQPFVPFRVHLSDGTTYDIRHRNFVMVGKQSVLIGMSHNPDDPFYDRYETVALIHVVRLEPVEVKSQVS